ncbi:dTMP kinase [Wukongibacter sp. M2B1]|uniref:dTMP kinase n=1 Tax=Wukongibacter sp. M2B1 TaxID=3088895 RepID=UPI003D7BF242
MGKKGKLITFCGIDGSGKSTHISMVYNYLKSINKKVKTTTLVTRNSKFFRILEPDLDVFPRQFNCDLIAFQRYMAIETKLKQELKEYDVILNNRYLYTDWAYTRGFDKSTDLISLLIDKVPTPDVVLLFDIEPEIAMNRIEKRQKEKWEFQENLRLLTETRNAYLKLAKERNFKIIDTASSKEDTFKQSMEYINNILE